MDTTLANGRTERVSDLGFCEGIRIMYGSGFQMSKKTFEYADVGRERTISRGRRGCRSQEDT